VAPPSHPSCSSKSASEIGATLSRLRNDRVPDDLPGRPARLRRPIDVQRGRARRGVRHHHRPR
jgi:hypothetical protein